MQPIISVKGLSKRYKLGVFNAKTLREEAEAFLARFGRKKAELAGGSSQLAGKSSHAEPSSDFWALRDVSFDVQPGEVIGVIGRNGAGKSTLLKILSRITEPTSGEARIRGRVASLLEVGTGFHPELTGRENVFLNGAILGMTKAEIRSKFDEIVEFAEISKFIDTPVKRYSSGMYVRLAFAVAAHLEPEILIVDEVLAVGDAEFQKKCLGKMKDVSECGRTVLFVSHNMAAVERLCQKAILLRGGAVAALGPVGEVTHEYLRAARDRSVNFAQGLKGEGIELGDIHFAVDGDDVVFTCTARSESIKTLGVGVQLDAITGERLAVLRPAKSGLYKPFDKGVCEVRLVLRGLVGVLPEGDYNISLWFSDAGKQAVLSVPDAYQLAVPHKDPLNTGHSFNQLEDGFIIMDAQLS